MSSTNFIILFAIVLSHSLMSSAQGQGNWNGNNGASSWSSSSSQGQPGQPGHSDVSYGYGGVDANGVPYGGSSGNGGFHINVSDEQGRTHSYNGAQGQGGFGAQPGQPGYAGQPGQPGYPGTFSYAGGNTHYNQGQGGYRNSSSSSFSSAWSTFYVIALFSLFLILKS